MRSGSRARPPAGALGHAIALPAVLVIMLAPSAPLAQNDDGSTFGVGGSGGEDGGPDWPRITSDAIADDIGKGREFCSWFPREVRIDCLADRFRTVAGRLPREPEYAPLRDALVEAADDLNEVSRRYAVPGRRPKNYRAPDPDGTGSIRTDGLREVATGNLDAAYAEALQVVEELETVLLRSAENSRQRKVNYQDVAAAVGSAKVLLRST